jgi:hypothetical protein
MATVDDRLTALESEVVELRNQVAAQKANWITDIAGSFRDEPEFDEVLRLGREARVNQSQDPSNGSGH